LLKAGVDCYMSLGTAKALGVAGHHRTHFFHGEWIEAIQKWRIITFPLEHDAIEPIGFFIVNETDRCLFVPDTSFVKNRFQGVTLLAIECNNASDILSEKVINGVIPAIVAKRIRRNHLSLQNVKEFILANNMARTLREIWLIHLSDTNSSEKRFKREIQETTGVPVYVA
jgi:phosphoribosyl 1,2-cyclic phosphodiesterase